MKKSGILMASRRLKSDRFFTDDFTPEIYTEFGIDHIKNTTMVAVIARQLPDLAPMLKTVQDAFAPWTSQQ